MFSFVLAGLSGYILGSFPTAFLFVRWKTHLDIRGAGSGNVGMLNSYLVTRSFPVAAAVLALDAAKGIGAVLLARAIGGDDFASGATGGACAIVGHNFPVWLAFRGGRGLATAAGVFALLAWPVVPLWGGIWLAGKMLLGDVNVANAAASLVTLLLAETLPGGALAIAGGGAVPAVEFRLFALAAFATVIVKHVAPVRAYILRRRAAGPADRGNVRSS